jgi:hypothetical protein
MAKDGKKQAKNKNDGDPVASALTAPDAPVEGVGGSVPAAGPPERLAVSHRPAPTHVATTDAATTGATSGATTGRSLADTAVAVAGDAARVVQRVLPPRTPAYLGAAALLVLGVVDLPAVAGGALAYEALRRWPPAS